MPLSLYIYPQLTPSVSSFLQCRRRKIATGSKYDTKMDQSQLYVHFVLRQYFACSADRCIWHRVWLLSRQKYYKPRRTVSLTLFISCTFMEVNCSFMTPTNASLIYTHIRYYSVATCFGAIHAINRKPLQQVFKLSRI